MRHRTKTHLLTKEQIDELLLKAEVVRLGTISEDGFPYVLPMHFVYFDNKIYMHGLPKGKKIDNIKFNSNVCFEVDEMIGLLYEGVENPCDVNTEFNSVIVEGKASLVSEFDEKYQALSQIVAKFTPHFVGKELPEKMIKGTAVIRIDILNCIGRYYK
ncbi:pyridoxamine 5'-phosphate oxidase family protein [Aliarcobacter butzleri]|uniref:pyridoxamine 5'-phosphate oxidase family protein n=1 Tax=Aliarcobacter butzleri TaxID=28197 RepID=UPI00189DED39|nr:pyridoxamine 5'-phosphate oxidase family protein [Aliarcobacter butzleri]MBF7066500.1 pyridoxamine 5'-phosphate oxidase family protein [Aliarcobacter butzleri]